VSPGGFAAIAGAGPLDGSLRIEMKQLQQAGSFEDDFVPVGDLPSNILF